jgi:hypothetical protein
MKRKCLDLKVDVEHAIPVDVIGTDPEAYWPAPGICMYGTLPKALIEHIIEATAQRVVEILAARRIGVDP